MWEIFLGLCLLFACAALNRIGNELEACAQQLERIGDDIEAME
ncbi:hypothetical protein [Bradyrhizobium hereditatis]|nr:hypothetical protein [Bradyrhizobium hereditatis]